MQKARLKDGLSLQNESVPVQFNINTGAYVNVINEDTFYTTDKGKCHSHSGGEWSCLGCFNVATKAEATHKKCTKSMGTKSTICSVAPCQLK